MAESEKLSVNLLIFKGKKFDSTQSELLYEYPFSFREIYDEFWKDAVKETHSKFLRIGTGFTVADIPQVSKELSIIWDWSFDSDTKHREYVQGRIREIQALLTGFELGLDGRDLEMYWFGIK